jgi:signal transduction histidine kinase
MSSETGKRRFRSAAWGISLLGTLAFAFGTLLVLISIHRFFANDIQHRSDAWLSGEVEVLGDVAERTPKDALYGRVLGEVAELVRREIPNRTRSERNANDSVFFLQVSDDGSLKLWAGPGAAENILKAIQHQRMLTDRPSDLRVTDFAIPFRVASVQIEDGSRVYLGLSERDELRVLNNLRLRFLLMWLMIVLLGFSMAFATTKRMLSRVQKITETASRIGHSDLNSRVPTTRQNDEVSHLALTLNGMLDRIELSMHQLHTITGSLAHDLRSPLTAIRGQLETSLSAATSAELAEPIASAMEELDQLTGFLTESLDLAEAKAGALRIARTEIDLNELLISMVDLYGPSMADRGLKVALRSANAVMIEADAALIHRMIGNLFDNELKHLPAACEVTIQLNVRGESTSLELEDNGPGFSPEVLNLLFKSRVKGRDSGGHGLGLAFIEAVASAHGGSVTASNREGGGARITVTLPLASTRPTNCLETGTKPAESCTILGLHNCAGSS